jgi:hypothetical protein
MRTTLFQLTLASLLTACGGSSELSSSTPVVDGAVTQVTVRKAILGGMPNCTQNATATYNRTSHQLAWDACTADAGATPAVSRVLNTNEAAQVDNALKAITLRPASEQVCGGYDGLDYTITTVDAAGHSARYSARDINCYGTQQVTGLPETYTLLDSLR